MTDIIHIPLHRLALWDGNVRKTDITVGIDELAQSIKAHGLLQSLVVRKGKRGKFEIVAGQRRYLALKLLADNGDLAKDCTIPCAIANDALDAGEISLAENVVRAPMHPADQFAAFRAVIDSGATVADVASRFGITESVVTKRLKLGRLSPVILDAYRNGDIDLEAAQAFTISDDREAQERVLAELPEWNRDGDAIRCALTADEVPTSDKRVRFVGLDAYRDAGGVIRQDLFSDDNEGYLQDSALLDRLVRDKLATEAALLSTESWCWVDIVPDADYSFLAGFKRHYPERAPLSEADQSELDRLSQDYDELIDSDDADEDRLADLEQRIDALSSRQFWPAESLAVAGAIVTLDYRGDLRVERGLVRKQDAHNLVAKTGKPDAEASSLPPVKGLSSRLIEDLTAQQSAALGAELLSRPDVALASVVHTLLLDAMYRGHDVGSCIEVHANSARLTSSMAKPETSTALAALDHERERLGDHLPGDPRSLFDWLLNRSRDELLDLLAFVVATSIDGVQHKADDPKSSRLDHVRQLARAVQLDMTRWFTPTAEGYFSRIARTQILTAIDDATGSHAPALEKLKKADLASRAEQLLAGTSWLPEPLRIAVNDNRTDTQSEAAE
jgi:ParB family chromosome partitioning protein